MEASHAYLEVGFPAKNEFSFVHAWIKCTHKNKEAIKGYFQYKLGSFAVLDDGTKPEKALKKFVLILPTDHNLPDVLASSLDEPVLVEFQDGEPSGYSRAKALPSLTIGVVTGECEEMDFPYLEEFIKENFVANMASPIPLDHYTVEIRAPKDKI